MSQQWVWKTHDAFRREPPSRDGLHLLADTVSRGSRVVGVRRLGGGLNGPTHHIRLRTGPGNDLDLVLKRFPKGDEEGATREWESLRFAERIEVPSPEPIALDPDGSWFGQAAIVMSKLAGRPRLQPAELAAVMRQIAEVILSTGSTGTEGLGAKRREKPWAPPAGLPDNDLVNASIAAASEAIRSEPPAKTTLGHGDFHPGNLLWGRGKVSGVTDWSALGLSSIASEVAYCRADLTVLGGVALADRLRSAYEEVTEQKLDDLWIWDLIWGLSALRYGKMFVLAYREQGRTDLSGRHVAPRINALLKKALDESAERGPKSP